MLLIAVLVYFGVFLFAYLVAESLIFQPQPSSYEDTDEIIKLESPDGGKISAIYLSNPDGLYTILFSHGNADDLGRSRPTLESLRAMGFSVFSYDYRGYGTSSGTASETNSYEDADAAYEHMVVNLRISPDKIIVMGQSLGGAVAVDLASRRDAAGLVVESSFVTAFRVLTHVPLFPLDKFESGSKIASVRCPVLVIHGTNDALIPQWHGAELLKRANDPKMSFWVEGAGHNDLPSTAGSGYERALREFVALIESRR